MTNIYLNNKFLLSFENKDDRLSVKEIQEIVARKKPIIGTAEHKVIGNNIYFTVRAKPYGC